MEISCWRDPIYIGRPASTGFRMYDFYFYFTRTQLAFCIAANEVSLPILRHDLGILRQAKYYTWSQE